MARQTSEICDICGNPVAEIVAKLYYAPFNQNGEKVRRDHSNYTHHLDVGSCCHSKIRNTFKWQVRKKLRPRQKKKRK